MILNNTPIDKNDRQSEKTALYIPWEIAKNVMTNEAAFAAIRYFDGTAWLFKYKGRLVVTDESLWLTDAGDGTRENPLGGPRYIADSLAEVEEWLAQVWEDIKEFEE